MKFFFSVLVVVLAWSSVMTADAQQKAEAPPNDGWKLSKRSTPRPLQFESNQPCTDGQAGTYPCLNVDLMSFMPIDSIGGKRSFDGKPITSLNDIWGWTDPESGREYALVGRNDGTSFVDVTDPTSPVYIGDLPAHNGAQSTWRDVKTIDHYAVIVADLTGEPHGMQIFDLHELRSYTDAPITFEETAHFGGFATAHNVVVNTESKTGYAVGTNVCRGLYMMDLENPLEPANLGCFSDSRTGRSGDGYTHDAQCVTYHGPDSEYSGQEVCFAANETHVLIADITDPGAPETISIAEYPANAYAHQGWLTEDHRFFLQDDELDELYEIGVTNTRTLIWDVAELEDPVLAGIYTGKSSAIDHNQYTRGNRVFQSNYTSGLRILDISDPARPEEVGYFDTYPAHDSAEFNGTWSNYPYFESGNVVVTGIDEGLFVLRPTKHANDLKVVVPDDLLLLQPYPNPFNSTTNIVFLVDEPQPLRVAVYDVRGKEVAELFSGYVDEPGRKAFRLDARGLSSGVYFVRAVGPSGIHTTTVTLQK